MTCSVVPSANIIKDLSRLIKHYVEKHYHIISSTIYNHNSPSLFANGSKQSCNPKRFTISS